MILEKVNNRLQYIKQITNIEDLLFSWYNTTRDVKEDIMEIICGKFGGFCFGVNYTVNKALETLNDNAEKIYCLGQIVHNERVIGDLENKGMMTVRNIDDVPSNAKLIIRAHGEPKEVIYKAKSKNIQIIDLTCGKIKAIIHKIEKAKDNSFIIIIGKKNHPETIGTLSYAGENSVILESMEDIVKAYEQMQRTNLHSVYIVSQTTFSSLKFDELVEEIKNTFGSVDIVIDKTICDATEKRQKEAYEIAKQVDKMIIIGGKNSSNTKELAMIASENCNASFLIQTVEDLKNIAFSTDDKVGIVAGASTPQNSIDEVIQYLHNLYS